MDQDQQIEPALTEFDEDQRRRAMEHFAVLRPYIDDGIPLSMSARDAGVPLRTVQRWLTRYLTNGIAGLVRTKRSDADHRKLSADLIDVIEGMALCKPRPSIAAIHRKMTAIAKQRQCKPPSYGSIYRVIRGLDPAMVTLAQDGATAFRDKYELIHRHRAERPNAIWQTDHTQMDCLVIDANGEAMRPWLTVVLDDYSRVIVGYSIFLGAPSALQTSLALRQAIWRKQRADWPVCGIPDILYVDHGSDFTSKHLEQVAADLRFQLLNHYRLKPVG